MYRAQKAEDLAQSAQGKGRIWKKKVAEIPVTSHFTEDNSYFS